MTDETASMIEVEFTPEFKKNLRNLAKKYRRIRSDVQPIISEIQKNNLIGNQIPKTGEYTVFKVRIKNSDIRKGKSGGYRLIYYVKNEKKIILITIYSKTEQSDITPEQIRQIMKRYENKELESDRD